MITIGCPIGFSASILGEVGSKFFSISRIGLDGVTLLFRVLISLEVANLLDGGELNTNRTQSMNIAVH